MGEDGHIIHAGRILDIDPGAQNGQLNGRIPRPVLDQCFRDGRAAAKGDLGEIKPRVRGGINNGKSARHADIVDQSLKKSSHDRFMRPIRGLFDVLFRHTLGLIVAVGCDPRRGRGRKSGKREILDGGLTLRHNGSEG